MSQFPLATLEGWYMWGRLSWELIRSIAHTGDRINQKCLKTLEFSQICTRQTAMEPAKAARVDHLDSGTNMLKLYDLS